MKFLLATLVSTFLFSPLAADLLTTPRPILSTEVSGSAGNSPTIGLVSPMMCNSNCSTTVLHSATSECPQISIGESTEVQTISDHGSGARHSFLDRILTGRNQISGALLPSTRLRLGERFPLIRRRILIRRSAFTARQLSRLSLLPSSQH